MVEPDIIIVSDKGQIVIPAYLRDKLGIKSRSKLLVYGMEDTIILKKLKLPDIKKEMQELWKEVDKAFKGKRRPTEAEIQAEIEKYRAEKRSRSKGA